jgi:hypothetical protein
MTNLNGRIHLPPASQGRVPHLYVSSFFLVSHTTIFANLSRDLRQNSSYRNRTPLFYHVRAGTDITEGASHQTYSTNHLHSKPTITTLWSLLPFLFDPDSILSTQTALSATTDPVHGFLIEDGTTRTGIGIEPHQSARSEPSLFAMLIRPRSLSPNILHSTRPGSGST